MACLFKAKLNGAEWEEGGIAPDPRSFFWPCGSLLYPFPHVYAAWGPGWNNEGPWWGARTAGNKNRLQKYHGLKQVFKTRGNSSRCRTKREWELGLLAEGLAVNPGSIICCVCVALGMSVSPFLSFCLSLSLCLFVSLSLCLSLPAISKISDS